MNGVRLVIVVPCYNEEEVLKETTRQLSDVLARMEQEGKVAEGKILYVDDGSKDTTWKLIEQLSESHRCVAGLKLAHNVGHQQALWAGLDFVAAGDYDAAVIAAGVCGFGMGATPNAMANMSAITNRYGNSIKAYLLIPIVGSLFADFINSLVITVFINLF